ncbi:hypothetical protein L6452_34799 [Arctium lappa]|uniref:Uncharacterized protein n=1 Tax=Arctium lappa TaxID=4217 RepID=A0ACB8YJB1_ARCLA|nr:hypothetical protein L6452_34799 [Arctium lappa]
MITGDNWRATRVVANEYSIQVVSAKVMTTRKVHVIRSFQKDGRIVDMMGDGIKKSPASVTTDVRMVIAKGTTIKIEMINYVLVKNFKEDGISYVHKGVKSLKEDFKSLTRDMETVNKMMDKLVKLYDKPMKMKTTSSDPPRKNTRFESLCHSRMLFDGMEARSSGCIIPRKGVDKEHIASRMITNFKLSLTKNLKEPRKLLRDPSINYANAKKESYILEKFECLNYIRELSKAEAEAKESNLKSIMSMLMGCFCEHHVSRRQLISTTVELNVFISIAIPRNLYEEPTCRPSFVDPSIKDEALVLVAKELGHPVLPNGSLRNVAFVPNDVYICGYDHIGHSRTSKKYRWELLVWAGVFV